MAKSKLKPIPDLSPASMKTFWSRIKPAGADECWDWIGSTFPETGYGKFTVATGKPGGKTYSAHRMMYKFHYGVDPGESHVLHRCDRRQCVNPAHLFLGSHQDNMDDRSAKNRQTRSGPHKASHGENHGRAKFSDETISDMRSDYSTGNYCVNDIARKYGMSEAHARQVLLGPARRGRGSYKGLNIHVSPGPRKPEGPTWVTDQRAQFSRCPPDSEQSQ